MVKKIVLLTAVALAACSSARAALPVVHDCRIHHLHLQASYHHDDVNDLQLLRIRLMYIGYDGGGLNPTFCPDMQTPTWGSDDLVPIRCLDDRCSTIDFLRPDPGRYSLEAVVSQGTPSRTIRVEKTFRIR